MAFNFLLNCALIVPLILLDPFTLSMFIPAVVFVLAGVVRATGAVIPRQSAWASSSGASACR